MSPAGTRVVGYVRVSTDRQDESGLGLGAQKAAIEAEAKHKGWVVVTILEDAESGKSMKRRPGLEAAMALVEAGGAEALVVAKLDRLSRSTVDFGNLLERAKNNNWKLVAIDMGLDMLSPNGELVAGILMNIAQWERRTIGARTKDALSVKRANGEHLGRASAVPDKVIARIKRERAAGGSLAAIAAALNEDCVPTSQGRPHRLRVGGDLHEVAGVSQWHASTVRAVLNRT